VLVRIGVLVVTLVTIGAADDPTDLAQYDATVQPSDRQHWAFQPVRRPTVPTPGAMGPSDTGGADWVRTPVDSFVLEKLQLRGWRPAPAAEPRAILRRVYLNIVGMPPSVEHQEAFLRDSGPESLDRVVDELLAHPGYGERWARHWLDLVRFAETNGYERDAAKPQVWRYRDYIIRSFNEDKPYDRFILEQLAGDELDDADADTLIATGFNRLGHWDDEPADPKEDRFDQLDDIVSTTAQVFLGLSLGCARCHNHKFEPLTQHDYYRMVAVFNPLVRPQNGRTELDMPVGTRAETEAIVERDRQVAAVQKEIAGLRDSFRNQFLATGPSKLPADAIEAFRADPAKRTEEQKRLVEKNTKQLDEELAAVVGDTTKAMIAELERRVGNLRAARPDLPRGYFMHEPSPDPPFTNLLLRGKVTRPGPRVLPGLPAVLVGSQPQFLPPGDRTSRRRLTLARWIASPDHPLTARVIVNRVWQFHFGEGLVRTPSEWGRSGQPPTHPELLDWLADWFVHDASWSLKRLHRLILTSNTYRMNKAWNATHGAADPENRLFWRVPYRRLEVEAIRDSMLAASGQLNTQMFGPSMYLEVPRAALEGHSDPDKIWKPFDEADASRRTVYAFVKRSMVVPMLEVLDLCDTTRSSAQRPITTIAPQALTLLNGDFANRQARHLADRVSREAGPDVGRQIERAYLRTLCRPPNDAERATMLEFLMSEDGSLEQCCRAVFNLNEFVYSD
jgi:hypothetical protein